MEEKLVEVEELLEEGELLLEEGELLEEEELVEEEELGEKPNSPCMFLRYDQPQGPIMVVTTCDPSSTP